MYRYLPFIAICLLLGITVNVTVAWLCGERSHKTVGNAQRLDSDADWPRAVPAGWPRPTFRATASGIGRTIYFLSADMPRGFYRQQLYQWGWPMRALEWENHSLHQPGSGLVRANFTVPKPIDPAHGFLRISPAWPGFLVNTLLYGALFWPLTGGWTGVQRFLRRRRGLCPMCTYNLRGDLATGCPECGWRRDGRGR